MDLVYKIQEGGVWNAGKVNVHLAGDYPHTRLNTVINRLSVRPGELIDSRELRNSERRLKASQLFEVDPSKGEPPRVAVRSPELAESIGNLAERGGTSSRSSSGPRRGSTPHGTYRGQSPD
jgi:outer membrane protein insertion porin family